MAMVETTKNDKVTSNQIDIDELWFETGSLFISSMEATLLLDLDSALPYLQVVSAYLEEKEIKELNVN